VSGAADDLKQIGLIVQALDAKKADNILVLDLRNQSSYLTYFVIATAMSRTHIKTLFDEVHKTAVDNGFERPRAQSPQFDSGWVTYDFGFYVIHLFEAEKRKFYNLESIWKGATIVKIGDTSSHSPESIQVSKAKKPAKKPESFAKKKTTIKKKTIKEKKMATKKKPAKKKAAKKKAAKKKK
jgi:ribosome-associated protein